MDSKKYFKIRKRYIPTVWPVYTYWVGMAKVTGIRSSILHLWEKGNIYTGFVDTEGIKKRGLWAYNYILDNYKNNLKNLREKGLESANNLILICEEFNSDLKNKDFKDYAKFYKQIDSLYIKYYEDNMLFWISAEGVVKEEIEKKLQKYNEEEKTEIWSVMSTPNESSYSNTEETEFFKLVEIAQKNGLGSNMFLESVKIFSKKYIWFPFEYGGPEIYDTESVIKRVSEILSSDKKEFEQKGENIETVDHQLSISEKYSLSEDVIFHFKILQTIALMQDDRKATNSHACYLVNGLILSQLSRITNLSVELLNMIDCRLIKELAETGDTDTFKKHLEKRTEMCVIYLSENDDLAFAEGEIESIKLLNNHGIKLEDEDENNEIKGQVAFKGKVTGIARLVKKSGECTNLNNGDILVTYMTTPDFVPYLDKVSAIVTEEGGITCHAAIVAREMKKPCIIGTGNVMSVLKDGDMVEVDAEKGIVRIIN